MGKNTSLIRHLFHCVVRGLSILALAPLGAYAADLPVIGRVVAQTDIVLSAQRSGPIISLNIVEGGQVTKGDIIAKSECSEDQARYDAALASGKALELEYETQKQLREYGSATELQLEKSQAEWMRSLAEAEIYNRALDNCVILAPVDGTISEVYISAFEFIDRGDQIARVIDNQNRYIEFLAPVSWLNDLTLGSSASVYFAALDRHIDMEIDRIGASIEPISQTVKMRGSLASADGVIPVGMAGEVRRASDMAQVTAQ